MIEFLILLGIAGACLYLVVMMLFNAHPHIAPAVKNGNSQSYVVFPATLPASAYAHLA